MLADRYDAILLDLDGVLYRWPDPIEGSVEAVGRLRAAGKRLAFITNNSSRTPQQVAERLTSIGIPAEASEVATSALATAAVLVERGIRSAFVVGEDGLREALTDAGISLLDADDGVPEAVVVGFDRSATYATLRDASVLVERGALLIASNADPSFPAPGGEAWPGAGALLAAVETTTGVRGDDLGKPHPPLFRRALEQAGGERPLVVGDRLDTDVAGAVNLGWDSALVLTGSTTREDLEASPWRPTHVVGSLADIA